MIEPFDAAEMTPVKEKIHLLQAVISVHPVFFGHLCDLISGVPPAFASAGLRVFGVSPRR
jgi:hypothetical protein